MAKIYEVFEHDIKRKFDDVMTVEDSGSIKAIDINEYVLTQNVEDILGNFAAYFFDDQAESPKLREKSRLLQDTYRDRIGPGVWIRGFFGAGKSHLLKVIYTIFSKESIPYMDEHKQGRELKVIESICEKLRNPEIAELIWNIHPADYLTFIFSANHIAKSGDTVVDCLPKEISRQLGKAYDEDRTYSALDVADFLKKTLRESGKKRMLLFIDEILDLLDTPDKVRKFEGLVELLPGNIWMIVTSLEAKTTLLDTVSAERMIHRFGEEQILRPEEMVWIVKNRYLAKGGNYQGIEKVVSIEKMKYLFGGALFSETEDGKITLPNMVASYPFYPFQLAYMKEMLKNEFKGSARNMMKTVKSIVKRPEVYNQEVGYFVGTDLIYEELKSKRGIEDEYSDLIQALESSPVFDEKQNPVTDKAWLSITLKAVVLLSQIKPEGVKDSAILPFVYSEDRIPNREKLLDALEVLVRESYISAEGGLYKPITKKESDVWSRVKGITSITETAIREKARVYIYKIYEAVIRGQKHIVTGRINDTSKEIAFVLKKSDESTELPNIYACIPFADDIAVQKEISLSCSNDKEKLYIIPEKRYEGDSLYKAIKFYLQMDEALERETDFGIDKRMRNNIETKRDTEIAGKIENMISECFRYAVISYNGQDDKDFSERPPVRLASVCGKMLKRKYTMFFGKMLRDSVNIFIQKEILTNSLKMTSQYLKDLNLIDHSGQVNTTNRYYNEFIKALPGAGFEKDGSAVIDEFTKGKYGWELDTVKIMTALALRNNDVKIALEGRVFVIPDDALTLTGSKGPLNARKRDVFDACRLTRINISDEVIKSAVKHLKSIDSNIAVQMKLKEAASCIKELMNKLADAQIDEGSALVDSGLLSQIGVVKGVGADIGRRNDMEEIVTVFNELADQSDMIMKFRQTLYIVDNRSNIDTACRIAACLQNCRGADYEKAVEAGKKYVRMELLRFEDLKKIYMKAYQQMYHTYRNTFETLNRQIEDMEEWQSMTAEQKEQVIGTLVYTEVSSVVFTGNFVCANGLGTLEQLRDKQRLLEASYSEAVKKLHTFNDRNHMPSDPDPKPQNARITKKISDYTGGRVINIDSDEKLAELEAAFEQIKENVRRELKAGKKITLQL